MTYKFKEYRHIFDTPAKMQQEIVVVSKIMDLLNKNKYNNIYDFINKNKTYQDFLKNNELKNVVSHFGNTLNEEDFKKIVEEIVKLTEKKNSFGKENLTTTNIGDKEYVTYEGAEKTVFLDNSHSNLSIERQMEELQKTQKDFQTSDTEKNTENMFNELEENKKENLNLRYLNEFDIENLNESQKEIYQAALNYQLNEPNPIRLDIDKGIIVNEFNDIMKIEKNGDQINIIGDNDKQKELNNNESITNKNSFQKTLTPNPNTIYSNNN